MRQVRNGTRRLSRVALALVSLVVVALIVSTLPAFAQTVTTTTSSFVNFRGNTVVTTDTYVNGVLTTRNQQEILPDGTVAVAKTWDFSPSGVPSRYEEHRVFGTSATTIVRTFDEFGVMLTEYADLSMNGQLSVQRFSTFDANGFLVTNEARVLTTLADGTRVWVVTQETYSGGVLVSSLVSQYPLGFTFTDPFAIVSPAPAPAPIDPVVTSPSPVPAPIDPVVTPPPPAPTPPPLPDNKEIRPGYGFGDNRHDHTGPPGQDDDHDRKGKTKKHHDDDEDQED